MTITVELPDDLFSHANPGREALEALAVEAYRSGPLSHSQASRVLGVSRHEFDGLLKRLGVNEHAYSVESLEKDAAMLAEERKHSVAA